MTLTVFIFIETWLFDISYRSRDGNSPWSQANMHLVTRGLSGNQLHKISKIFFDSNIIFISIGKPIRKQQCNGGSSEVFQLLASDWVGKYPFSSMIDTKE